MKSAIFQNYWFATGTPTFLMKMMREDFHYKVDNIEVGENMISNFRIEALNETTLLFQTDYLTIKEVHDNIYILAYPNREVKNSFVDYLLQEFAYDPNVMPLAWQGSENR